MKVTVAINNYNYSRYIIDAIDSVLNQDYPNIELIIVDDGSTDNSLDLLKSTYLNDDIKIIAKNNGGQLSAFNILPEVVSGDVVFFLDSDDVFKETYISETVNIYKENPDIDFVFCDIELFYTDGKIENIKAEFEFNKIKSSVYSSYFNQEWIGNPTSTISMRVDLLKKLLPIELENDWITRADDCLVWGSSLIGARKFYNKKNLVNYRVHGNNHFFGKILSEKELKERQRKIHKLLNYVVKKNNVNINSIYGLLTEYFSREDKISKTYRYANILRKMLFKKLKKPSI